MGGPDAPEAVLAIARQHLAGRPPVEGFVRQLLRSQRVPSGWYFDYSFDRLPSNPPSPGSGMGGAPGFVVSDDGFVRVVSWHELREVRPIPPGK